MTLYLCRPQHVFPEPNHLRERFCFGNMLTLLPPEQLLTHFGTSFSTDITWIQTEGPQEIQTNRDTRRPHSI
ncbi:hypothetical protein DPMN_115341 [Dreissena polymorpha]|uniref:Uncharacterized protein n=1 Tax=Dreissena polymorpha TaxID=45954 RepID=A0A9D4QTN6_DREPO|nr:hypothetical protein DPMN_115341 [Dreissena polymorpha]